MSLHAVDCDYAHRLATMLECALLNRLGSWDEGHALLDEYRAACRAAMPDAPTFMGEPVIDDVYTAELVEIDGHTYGLRPGAARVVKEALADDPELDCTDFAKPAWWRGEAYGSSAAIAAVTRILDGKDDGHGVANEPWQSVRTRLREAMRDAGRAAMLESMLACEREKVTNAVRLLTEIHSLLYPAHITAEDGRVWAFRPRSIDPHEVLQEVSDRIRELPEKIAAMAKDGAP